MISKNDKETDSNDKETDSNDKERTCLKCSKSFLSIGVGNRICKKCSQINGNLKGGCTSYRLPQMS